MLLSRLCLKTGYVFIYLWCHKNSWFFSLIISVNTFIAEYNTFFNIQLIHLNYLIHHNYLFHHHHPSYLLSESFSGLKYLLIDGCTIFFCLIDNIFFLHKTVFWDSVKAKWLFFLEEVMRMWCKNMIDKKKILFICICNNYVMVVKKFIYKKRWKWSILLHFKWSNYSIFMSYSWTISLWIKLGF